MKIVRAILIGLAVAIVLLGGFAWLNYDKIEKPLKTTYRRFVGSKAQLGSKPFTNEAEYKDARLDVLQQRTKAMLSHDESEEGGISRKTAYYLLDGKLVGAEIEIYVKPDGSDKLLVSYSYRNGKPFEAIITRKQVPAGKVGQMKPEETEKETVVWQEDGKEFKHEKTQAVSLPEYAGCGNCYREAQDIMQRKEQRVADAKAGVIPPELSTSAAKAGAASEASAADTVQ